MRDGGAEEFRGDSTVGPRPKLKQRSIAPTPHRLVVVMQSSPLYKEVDRNGETNSPRGLAIWSPPNRLVRKVVRKA